VDSFDNVSFGTGVLFPVLKAFKNGDVPISVFGLLIVEHVVDDIQKSIKKYAFSYYDTKMD